MTIPFFLSYDETMRHFLTQDRMPSGDDIFSASVRLGRNNYPALVGDLDAEGLLAADVAARVVPDAWCSAEFPNRQLDEETWGWLFTLAGYTVDGVPADRPTAALRLWRGAVPEHRLGWSWTDDEQQARWFADRPFTQGLGRVWTALVDPIRLLARIDEWRGESEWVVDTRGPGFECSETPQHPRPAQ